MKNRILSALLAVCMLTSVVTADMLGAVASAIEQMTAEAVAPVQDDGALEPPDFTLSYVSFGEASEEKQMLIGSGRENDPYMIYSPEAFLLFSELVNGDELAEKIYAELCVNIDFRGEEWTPIGYRSSAPFYGEFKGNGHEIINLKIGYDSLNTLDSEAYYVGLFGYVKESIIRDLGVSCYSIDQSYTYDMEIGGLCGHAESSEIENCYADGRISTSFDLEQHPFERSTVEYHTVPEVIVPTDSHGVGAILDLRMLEADSTNTVKVDRRMIVAGDVSSLKVIGDPSKFYSNFLIYVADHDVLDLSIELVDVHAFGSIYATSVSNREIYLKSSGKSNSLQYLRALNFGSTSVIITGDADLTLYGLKGGDGENAEIYDDALPGFSGYNGSQAVECKNLVIASSAKVIMVGGTGGKGGQGGQGSPGVLNTYAPGTGGIGGMGGDGAIALNTDCTISVHSGELYLQAGDGGQGGQGGIGGQGYQGATGANAYRGGLFGIGWHYGENGGQGGIGGNGGVGGNGGDPGVATYSKVTVYGDGVFTSRSGISGAGGKGGQGGQGGTGGIGGSCDAGNACKNGYSNCNCGGKGGLGGRGGQGGNGSTAGLAGDRGAAGAAGWHSTELISCYCVGTLGIGTPGLPGTKGGVQGRVSQDVVSITGQTEAPALPEGVFIYAPLTIGGLVGILDESSVIGNSAAILSMPAYRDGCFGYVAGVKKGEAVNVFAVEKCDSTYIKHRFDLWFGKGEATNLTYCNASILAPQGLYQCVDDQGLVFDIGISADNRLLNERTVYNCLANVADVAVPEYVFSGRFIGIVNYIEQYAFKQSGNALRSVNLGSAVDTIGKGILEGCFHLETITIGKLLVEIPEYENGAFLFGLDKNSREVVNPLKYVVSTENERFMADNYGILYECRTIELNGESSPVPLAVIDAPKKKNLSGYSIPAQVALIKPYAFAYNETLSSVDLSYVMTVEECAFYKATALQSVRFTKPASDDKYVEILGELVNAGQLNVPQIIGDSSFYGCVSLREADLSGASVISIGNDAFADCGGNLERLVIGEKVISIGKGAFGTRSGNNATAIGWISVEKNNSVYRSIDGVLYRSLGDGKLSLVSYPVAKRRMQNGKEYAERFEIPKIDDSGKAVEVYQIEEDAFAYVRYLKEAVIDGSVEIVGTNAFAHSSLTRVHLGASVRKLGSKPEANPHEVFVSCGALESITVDGENSSFIDLDGVLYECSKENSAVTTLIKYPAAKNQSEYVLPNTVLNLLQLAFEDADHLEKVVITSALRTVGENAFADCSHLSSIYFKGVSAPKHIGNNAFTTYDLTLIDAFDPRTTVYYDESAYDESWEDLIEFHACTSCAPSAHNGFHFAPYREYAVGETDDTYYTFVVIDKRGNPVNDVYLSLTDANGTEVSMPTIGGMMTVIDQYDQYGVGFDIDFEKSFSLRVVDNRGEYFPVENPAFYPDEELKVTYLTLSSVPSVSAVNVSYEVDGDKITNLLTQAAASVVLGEGKKTVDINSESATINKWCISSFDVLVSCGLDFDATVSEYRLMQGDTVLCVNSYPKVYDFVSGGKRTVQFTLSAPTEKMVEGGDLSLFVTIESSAGEPVVIETPLKIKVISMAFAAPDFSFLGQERTLAISPKLSEIFKGLGKELPVLDKWNIEIAVEIKEDAFLIAIGGGSEKQKGEVSPEEQLNVQDFKSFFKKWTSYKSEVKGNGGVSKTPFSFEKTSTVEKRITGFVEIRYKGLTESGEQDIEVTSGVTGSLGFTKRFGATYYLVFVPVRLDAQLSFEGKLTLELTFDYEAEAFITPEIELEFEGGIVLEGGVGVRFASMGIYGSLKMMLVLEIVPDFELEEWSAEGDLGFFVKYDGLFLKWKYTHSFINGRLVIYKDGVWLPVQGNAANLSDARLLFNKESYVIAESKAQTVSGLSSLDGQTVQNAYEQSSPRIIRVGDQIYTFYYADLYALGYTDEYDSYNYQKIVYQIYDLNENVLSNARILDDNGYADGAFSLSCDGQNVTVLYAQSSRRLDADDAEDVTGYLSSLELKIASGTGNEFSVSENTITENGYYEMYPTLSVENGKTIAVWVENRENTLFGTTEEKGLAIIKSVIEEGIPQQPVLIKEGIGSICDLVVCKDGVCFITDENNDLFTVGSEGMEGFDDRQLYCVGLDGTILRTSEQADAYHDLSVIEDQTVYYLRNELYSFGDEKCILSAKESSSLLPENYTVLHSEEGMAKAIFFVSGAALTQGEGSSDLYGIFYDEDTECWGKPIRLTDYGENVFVTAFDAVDLGERFYLTVALSSVSEGVLTENRLERCVLSYPEKACIEDVAVDSKVTSLIDDGGLAGLVLTVKNEGYKALTTLPVIVKRGENILFDETVTIFYDEDGQILDNGIPSGSVGYVKLSVYDNVVSAESYTVIVEDAGRDIKIWHSDLRIYSKHVRVGDGWCIVARICNEGFLPTEKATLIASANGIPIGSFSLSSLAFEEELFFEIPIPADFADSAYSLTVSTLEHLLESTTLSVDLFAPADVYLPFDRTYLLKEIVVDECGYDSSSGLYRFENGVLVINGAFLSELIAKEDSVSVCYRLTSPTGAELEISSLLQIYSSYEFGDIDADGKVSISDVTALLNYLASSAEGKQEMIKDGKVVELLLDVNKDHAISISDVTELLNILADSN